MKLFVSVSTYLLGKQMGIEAANERFQMELATPHRLNMPPVKVIHRLQALGHDVHLFHAWASDLPKLRSRAAASFLLTDCEAWLTVDDDVDTDQRTLGALLAIARPEAISVLPCLLRGVGEEANRLNVIYASPLVFDRNGHQARRLLRGGTGLMVVSRPALEAIWRRFEAELAFIDDDGRDKVALFAQILSERRWYGEDYSFCLRAAAAEVPIYAPADGHSVHDQRHLDLSQIDVDP